MYVVLCPSLALSSDLFGKVVVPVLPVGPAAEEGHDVVEVRVVNLHRYVAVEKGATSELGRWTGKEATHWTHGCTLSLYHSGNRVDLRTIAFIDMSR